MTLFQVKYYLVSKCLLNIALQNSWIQWNGENQTNWNYHTAKHEQNSTKLLMVRIVDLCILPSIKWNSVFHRIFNEIQRREGEKIVIRLEPKKCLHFEWQTFI